MRTVLLLLLSASALIGCAPPTSMPPPVPMASTDREIGVAVNGAYPINGDPIVGGDVQIWDMQKLGDRVDIGEVVFAGTSSVVGGGGFLRYRLNNGKGFYFGGQAEIGLGWGGLGLPVAGKIGDKLWLYTNPTFRVVLSDITGDIPNLTLAPQIHLPMGVSLGLGNGFRVSSEVNASYGASEFYYADGHARFGLSLAKRW